MAAWFQQLGPPSGPALTSLPDFPKHGALPQTVRQPWPQRVCQALGAAGEVVLDNLLTYDPALRLTARGGCDSNFLHPERFPLGGILDGGRVPHLPLKPYSGRRHAWNYCSGQLPPDALEYLRGDPDLIAHISKVSFLSPTEAKRQAEALQKKGLRYEQGRKELLALTVGLASGSAMCGLHLQPCRFKRLLAFRNAFMRVNEKAFATMDALARGLVQKIPLAERGLNGTHFLSTPLNDIMMSSAELHSTWGGNVEEGFWEEPEHQDGAGSGMHMALTLWGRRVCLAKQVDGAPDILLRNVPGTVYMGQLTGPEHQVTHQEAPRHEYFHMPAGALSVSVMFRSALFPHCRSRLRGATPSPWPVFERIVQAFRETMSRQALLLPSLKDIVAAEGQLLDQTFGGECF